MFELIHNKDFMYGFYTGAGIYCLFSVINILLNNFIFKKTRD